MTHSNTILLFGGVSEERRVSVASAQNMYRAFTTTGLWFISSNGAIHECQPEELFQHVRPFEEDFKPRQSAVFPSLAEGLSKVGAPHPIFILALHGGEGEDGTVQKLFEKYGVAFTGSGSAASADAFDKRTAKKKAKELGIKICPQIEIGGTRLDQSTTLLKSLLETHGELIAKPVAGGSSIGLFRVQVPRQISELVNHLEQHKDVAYLVEPFVTGLEVTVGIYDGPHGTIALPPTEVRLQAGHNFDYEGKYLGRGTEEITPAQIPDSLTAAVQKISLQMHQALGCEGYSRTDLILSAEGPVYLETNTLPGLTKASFIPQQLAAAQISFKDFLWHQIQIGEARSRHSRRPLGAIRS